VDAQSGSVRLSFAECGDSQSDAHSFGNSYRNANSYSHCHSNTDSNSQADPDSEDCSHAEAAANTASSRLVATGSNQQLDATPVNIPASHPHHSVPRGALVYVEAHRDDRCGRFLPLKHETVLK
jgi:hypothetical protein